MRGGELIREARTRAGLTQADLAERTARDRSVIARWEHGAVSPPVESLLACVHACGFDIPLCALRSHHPATWRACSEPSTVPRIRQSSFAFAA